MPSVPLACTDGEQCAHNVTPDNRDKDIEDWFLHAADIGMDIPGDIGVDNVPLFVPKMSIQILEIRDKRLEIRDRE